MTTWLWVRSKRFMSDNAPFAKAKRGFSFTRNVVFWWDRRVVVCLRKSGFLQVRWHTRCSTTADISHSLHLGEEASPRWSFFQNFRYIENFGRDAGAVVLKTIFHVSLAETGLSVLMILKLSAYSAPLGAEYQFFVILVDDKHIYLCWRIMAFC